MVNWKDQLLCFLETARLKNMFHCSSKTKYPQLCKVTVSAKFVILARVKKRNTHYWCDRHVFILPVMRNMLYGIFTIRTEVFQIWKERKKSTDATLMMIQQTSFMFAREITVTSMWWVQQQIKPQIRDAQPQSYRNCIEHSGPYQQENFPKACNAVVDPNSGVQLQNIAIEFQAYHYWKGFNRKKLPASSQLFTINFSGMLHKITKLSLLPVTYKSLY